MNKRWCSADNRIEEVVSILLIPEICCYFVKCKIKILGERYSSLRGWISVLYFRCHRGKSHAFWIELAHVRESREGPQYLFDLYIFLFNFILQRRGLKTNVWLWSTKDGNFILIQNRLLVPYLGISTYYVKGWTKQSLLFQLALYVLNLVISNITSWSLSSHPASFMVNCLSRKKFKKQNKTPHLKCLFPK